MKWTKKWGTVNSSAELYMLNHAERSWEKSKKFKNPNEKNTKSNKRR